MQVWIEVVQLFLLFGAIFGTPLSLAWLIDCYMHRGTNYNGCHMKNTYKGDKDYVEFIDASGGLQRREIVVQYRMMWFGNLPWLMEQVLGDLHSNIVRHEKIDRKITNLRIGKFVYAV